QVTDYDASKDIGLKGATVNRSFPRMNTSPYTTPLALGGMNAMGPASQTYSPERRPSITTNLTWVRGRHSLKFGADWRQDMYPNIDYTNTAGSYSFGGPGGGSQGVTWDPALLGLTFTGNSNIGFNYANFLMGAATGVTLAVPVDYRRSKRQYGVFVQD